MPDGTKSTFKAGSTVVPLEDSQGATITYLDYLTLLSGNTSDDAAKLYAAIGVFFTALVGAAPLAYTTFPLTDKTPWYSWAGLLVLGTVTLTALVLVCVFGVAVWKKKANEPFKHLRDRLDAAFVEKPASPPILDVLYASYGIEGKSKGVTEIVRTLILDNRVSFKVTNEILGGDPAKSEKKKIFLRYRYGREEREVTVQEKEMLEIPSADFASTGAPHHGKED